MPFKMLCAGWITLLLALLCSSFLCYSFLAVFFTAVFYAGFWGLFFAVFVVTFFGDFFSGFFFVKAFFLGWSDLFWAGNLLDFLAVVFFAGFLAVFLNVFFVLFPTTGFKILKEPDEPTPFPCGKCSFKTWRLSAISDLVICLYVLGDGLKISFVRLKIWLRRRSFSLRQASAPRVTSLRAIFYLLPNMVKKLYVILNKFISRTILPDIECWNTVWQHEALRVC